MALSPIPFAGFPNIYCPYEHLSEKLENDQGLTLREREFVEEYEALLQTMGKDAVIRRENKTKPRKKKAVLDDAKDG